MTALEEYEKHRASAELTPLSAGIAALADAAIESLKCCGNCGHGLPYGTVCDYAHSTDRELFTGKVTNKTRAVEAPHSCYFTPSRWKERTP